MLSVNGFLIKTWFFAILLLKNNI